MTKRKPMPDDRPWKSRTQHKSPWQPYPKGTLYHDFFEIINTQRMPDTELGPMAGYCKTYINKLRMKNNKPSLQAMIDIAQRCGYCLRFVPISD